MNILGMLARLWKGREYIPMAVRMGHGDYDNYASAVEMRPNAQGVYVEASADELDREVMLNLACPKYVLIDLACDIVVSEGKVDDLLEDALRYRDANPDDEVTLCIYEKKSVVHL